MANEGLLQQFAEEQKTCRVLLEELRVLTTDQAVAAATAATAAAALQAQVPSPLPVTGFPATQAVTGTFWPATQPVSVGGTVNVAVTNVPVGSTVAVSLTATGDLVAAQAGVAIRLLAGAFGSTVAVTVAVRDGETNKIPLRVGVNDTVVLPFCPTGWVTTAAGNALQLAFSTVGGPTVTGYALWVAV